MSGSTIVIVGQISAPEELTINGRVDGQILCERGAVVIAATAQVRGDVYARDITVLGRADGQLVATEVVDVRAGAVVTGKVIAPRIILHDTASFNGRVEPQHLEAALSVLRYRQKQSPGPDSAAPRSAAASL